MPIPSQGPIIHWLSLVNVCQLHFFFKKCFITNKAVSCFLFDCFICFLSRPFIADYTVYVYDDCWTMCDLIYIYIHFLPSWRMVIPLAIISHLLIVIIYLVVLYCIAYIAFVSGLISSKAF